ncbi:SPOR domain-containing protein [Rhodovulum sp. 12E13]|nr:SPOR domain-containing protein [Rhodovulum sp. 12E13]
MAAALHVGGAIASLALVVGIGVWGYGQVMRDVSGVPVVQALDGPMRVAPEVPGGQIADHAGLAVNEVKAGGAAAAPPQRLRLAPEPVTLAEEDLPAPELAPAPPAPGPATERAAQADASPPAPRPAPATAEGLPVVEARFETTGMSEADAARAAAIVAAITEEIAPLGTDGGDSLPAAEIGAGSDEAAETVELAMAGPGLARSLRPVPRPGPRMRPASVPASSTESVALGAEAAPEPAAGDMGPVEPGTRLVQLGAYDSVEEARAAWGDIAARFAPMLDDKARVLEEAEAGGRAFWRLRAQGFGDLASARRFCAALVADQADCIPVVAR